MELNDLTELGSDAGTANLAEEFAGREPARGGGVILVPRPELMLGLLIPPRPAIRRFVHSAPPRLGGEPCAVAALVLA